VRICGAAVWSLRGNAMTGVVTDSKTKEIEHLISQQAQMDICDPRMVLWRASFVSILKTMCQNFWVRRKGAQGQGQGQKTGSADVPSQSQNKVGWGSVGTTVFSTDFGYEFCFEAPNGSVKWYKVQGHIIEECSYDSQFEVTGSMQEVTSMLIDKVMGDRWQKWWNRMCHMVFDATLLVDTQEYRVLNAWGEEKVFGVKLQPHHPLLPLIKPEDTVSLKEAFNEVTFKGFERGRTLHLIRPGCSEEQPAQCFLLSADQENPNECMMGIRLQVSATQEDHPVLWDVAKPNPVLTLEDLARLRSGLKRSHRKPSRTVNLRRSLPHRSRTSDPHTSSHSLSSIPEDLHGEFEEMEELSDSRSEASARSSSNSSKSSKSSRGSNSEVGVCNSSPARSATEEPTGASPVGEFGDNPFKFGGRLDYKPRFVPSSRMKTRAAGSSSPPPDLRNGLPSVRVGPAKVKLKWGGRVIEEALDLDEFPTVQALREKIDYVTGVPPCRQTLILAGKRLAQHQGSALDTEWNEIRALVKTGQALMLVGSVPPPGDMLSYTGIVCTEGLSPIGGATGFVGPGAADVATSPTRAMELGPPVRSRHSSGEGTDGKDDDMAPTTSEEVMPTTSVDEERGQERDEFEGDVDEAAEDTAAEEEEAADEAEEEGAEVQEEVEEVEGEKAEGTLLEQQALARDSAAAAADPSDPK